MKKKKEYISRDWRLVLSADWAMDKYTEHHWPEDDWIASIDGDDLEEDCSVLSVDRMLEGLTAREKEIVYSVAIDGETFQSVADRSSLSKQRVHQIYRSCLEKLKGTLGGVPSPDQTG